MRVAFLYNRSSEDPAHAAEDVVPARSPVVDALKRLGHGVTPVACTLDLAAVRRRLIRAKPDVVFNRVESLGGSDAMMAAITLLLDSMRIPYTGNSTAALVATASKVCVKERLLRAGLPTPGWVTTYRALAENCNARFIIKSVYEHASFELDDSSIIWGVSQDQISALLRDREATTGRAYFAEEFVDGREFNLSLIGPEPRVLPPAEIDFSTFPPDKERIVGRMAKCDPTSFEYHNTERLFDFSAVDHCLLQRLSELAVECWRLFDLRGYARVDFRIDSSLQPLILDINTNPCASPDAGFAAALEYAGMDYHEGVQAIIYAAMALPSLALNRPEQPPVGI